MDSGDISITFVTIFDSTSYMFKDCPGVTSIDLSSFDISQITMMTGMFYNCQFLKSIDFGTSYTNSIVIKMESMFENCKSLTKIDLSRFYTHSLKQVYNIFSGCSSLTEIKIQNFDTFQITNFAKMFYNCQSLNQINIAHFITNMTSDLSHMFYNCSKLSNLDLSNFKTKRVTKMNSMFEGCSSLLDLKLNNFDTEQVTNMERMFKGCTKLKSLDLDVFNTSIVTNMKEMFSGCLSLTTLSLTSFNTQNVINMNSMFKDCSSLISLDITTFDTSNVSDMNYMFYKCSSLTSIDLSKFKTHNVERIEAMFFDCQSLKTLSLASFNTSKINTMKSTFHGCILLKQLDISHFDTSNVEYMDDLFYDCSSLVRFNLSNFNLSKVKLMSYMFYGCKSMTSLFLPNITNLRVTNTSHMFTGCSSLISLNLSNFDTSDVTTMDYMFSGCSYLKNLELNNWDTRKVLSMEYIFSGCLSLTSIDINHFQTPNLKTIRGMFYGCSSLKFMNLSSFDTNSVTNMAYMFYKAISLTSLQLYTSTNSSPYEYPEEIFTYFKTNSLINMEYMFAYCSRLENIDLSFFDTSNVVDMSHMFEECTILTSVNLSNFDTIKVTSMDYMFYKCLNLSYINLEKAFAPINNLNNHITMDNILTDSLLNMVFCINEDDAAQLNVIIDKKNNPSIPSICAIINCTYNYTEIRKKVVYEGPGNSSYRCLDECKSEKKYDYLYMCYEECPNGTFHFPYRYKCLPNSEMPDPCTIQKVLINECVVDNLTSNYTESIEDIVKFIDDLKEEILKEFTLYDYLKENRIVSKTLFNITFAISILSNKYRYDNLSFIDIKDCENILKVENGIDKNEELILLKLEYILEHFKIPAIEYTIYNFNGKMELNFSYCQDMNFTYSYPVEIDETEEYKYNPDSDYNNEICFQYTTENNTDIILYEKRKEFNEYNLSLCENNCKYIGYYSKRAECECPVKLDFNKFLLEDKSVQDNLIYRFQNNHMKPVNFGIFKCFTLLFTSKGYSGNKTAILYAVILSLDFLGALYFCLKGYKNLYSNIKYVSEGGKKSKKSKKLTKVKNEKKGKKESLITTGNNPPPKIKKGELSKSKTGKKKDSFKESKELGSKVNAPSSLIDSKNALKNLNEGNLSILNRFKENEAYIFGTKPEMEINRMPYSEALEKDKRSFGDIYGSFLKTRHILVNICMEDNNSFVIEFTIFLFTFGVCLGVNTIFFDDSVIQNIYMLKGTYTNSFHISSKMPTIIISSIITSIIKSIILFVALTDISILEINDNNGMSMEEKINKALAEVTSKSTIFYIINFALLFICWIYAGSFCAVFKNTADFLLLSTAISFSIVLFLPFLYYLLAAGIRKWSLNGGGKEKLYKFSQFFGLI